MHKHVTLYLHCAQLTMDPCAYLCIAMCINGGVLPMSPSSVTFVDLCDAGGTSLTGPLWPCREARQPEGLAGECLR